MIASVLAINGRLEREIDCLLACLLRDLHEDDVHSCIKLNVKAMDNQKSTQRVDSEIKLSVRAEIMESSLI